MFGTVKAADGHTGIVDSPISRVESAYLSRTTAVTKRQVALTSLRFKALEFSANAEILRHGSRSVRSTFGDNTPRKESDATSRHLQGG